jgi:hypothetical protein
MQRKGHEGCLFLHDNTPAYRALASQKKLGYLGFQSLDHHPILQIAPSYPHLVLELKNFLSDTEVIAAAQSWLDGQYSEFLSVLQKL